MKRTPKKKLIHLKDEHESNINFDKAVLIPYTSTNFSVAFSCCVHGIENIAKEYTTEVSIFYASLPQANKTLHNSCVFFSSSFILVRSFIANVFV